jgi:uncharacterized protein YggT (Ycf19 family)
MIALGVFKNIDNIIFKLYIFLMDRIEPILSLFRRFIPPVFGVDLSTLIVFLAIHMLKTIIIQMCNMLV